MGFKCVYVVFVSTSSISVVIRVEVIVDYCSNTRQISLELKLKLL